MVAELVFNLPPQSAFMSSTPKTRPIAESAQQYGRGIAGGLLFSLPLLFTAEVWSVSFTLEPWRLLLCIAAAGAVLMLYNRFAGLTANPSWLECALDAVEEIGLGLLIAAGMLWLVGRIEAPLWSLETLGPIVVSGLSVAMGVSVGTAQLGQNSEERPPAGRGELAQGPIAFCGAIVFVANIAPTEEVLLIALSVGPGKLLLIALLSLFLSGFILYFSEFRGSQSAESPFEIVRGVLFSYAVALVATAGTLAFFGRFDGETPITNLSQTVVAGLAGALGASAGRFLLQLDSNSESEEDDEPSNDEPSEDEPGEDDGKEQGNK